MQQASTWEETQLNDEVKYVQFEKLEDIIKMMSASMRAPPLHHKEVKMDTFTFSKHPWH
jgi:hypothetical protein